MPASGATILILLLTLCGLTAVARGQDVERPLWEQEAMLIYSASSPEFNRLRSLGQNNERLALYTRALEILHGQVETDEGSPHQAAENLFSAIAREGEEDAIGLASRYYLAEIARSRPDAPDLVAAKRRYHALFEDHANRFFGQMALLKYVTLEIYDDDGTGERAFKKLQELEALLPKATLPEIRRNFHRILGEAYVGFELDARLAYHHLDRAYSMGIPVESIRVDVLAQLAQLAEELGEVERALAAYDELALLAPRHAQISVFRERARELRRALNQAATR